MTDRYNALVVTLEKDIREDDAESLIKAIQHLRGVLSVQGHVPDIDAVVANMRAQQEWRKKIGDLLWPPEKS